MKKKTSEILNVPAIQKEIREKHNVFIKKYGSTIEKVMADHKLFTDIILAKLSCILAIFKQEAVIDAIQVTEQGPFKKITLTKNGYDTYVVIETNGVEIALQGYTYTGDSVLSDFALVRVKIRNVNSDNFDWVDFSSQLIDYIHSTIYEKQEVVQQRLKGMLADD